MAEAVGYMPVREKIANHQRPVDTLKISGRDLTNWIGPHNIIWKTRDIWLTATWLSFTIKIMHRLCPTLSIQIQAPSPID